PGQQPNWQPISALARVAAVIDGQLAAVKDQHRMLVTAAGRPYSLDNATVERVVRVFGETADGLWLYDEQLRRWANRRLTETQRTEVERLGAQVDILRDVVGDVLSLATRLKGQTIEAMLAKSDLELGIEGLLGGEEGRGASRL
ncbi:MAG: hypothetical protein LC799_12385, partial [Actinobacteria bacterium]|nr:hypothetical protein [Actinomycetota bacterium]